MPIRRLDPHRRRLLTGAAALAALSAARVGVAAADTAPPSAIDARTALRDAVTVDIHSHAGRIIGMKNVATQAPFSPVASKMREGGMAVICLAIVPDAPTHHITSARRIEAYRDPSPGELPGYAQQSFERLHALAREQQLDIVHNATELRTARSAQPAVIVTAEGADFLEGRADRLDDAYARWSLRHLQLTHYRVNELGDIQTEAPVHNGLTPAGAEVIQRCNRLGIVVDVAHATLDMVKQAAVVAVKPLVLSHTSLATSPGPRSRMITPEHARVIASTGGVIGVWPPASIFPDLPALAAGIARMVDVVGVDHVGLGTDMRGLVGPSVFRDYDDLPALAQALLDRGFTSQELRQILGGNYLRVFEMSVGEA